MNRGTAEILVKSVPETFGNWKRNSVLFLSAVLCTFCFACGIGCQWETKAPEDGKSALRESSAVPERVVSLSPALTECMYALGLETRLAGVTKHCKYPPEALKKTQVGTIFAPNLEIMGALNPDCVLMTHRESEKAELFREFGWNPEMIRDASVDDVFAGIAHLGKLFQAEAQAENLTNQLKKRLEALKEKTGKKPKVRLLLVLSRNYLSENLEEVYLVGHDELCEPLLEIAGGKNVYSGNSPFPKVSAEGILSMNPDVILEVCPDAILKERSKESLTRAWQTLPMLKAVKNGKIFQIAENEAALIPGPSMVTWAEKTAKILEKAGETKTEK